MTDDSTLLYPLLHTISLGKVLHTLHQVREYLVSRWKGERERKRGRERKSKAEGIKEGRKEVKRIQEEEEVEEVEG